MVLTYFAYRGALSWRASWKSAFASASAALATGRTLLSSNPANSGRARGNQCGFVGRAHAEKARKVRKRKTEHAVRMFMDECGVEMVMPQTQSPTGVLTRNTPCSG